MFVVFSCDLLTTKEKYRITFKVNDHWRNMMFSAPSCVVGRFFYFTEPLLLLLLLLLFLFHYNTMWSTLSFPPTNQTCWGGTGGRGPNEQEMRSHDDITVFKGGDGGESDQTLSPTVNKNLFLWRVAAARSASTSISPPSRDSQSGSLQSPHLK